MADSTLGQKKDKMSREHLVVPENEEMLMSNGETTEGQGLQFKGDPTVKTGADWTAKRTLMMMEYTTF